MLKYKELTEPERAVWNAIEAGVLVKLPVAGSVDADPAAGDTWGEDRQIRAQFLYELLAGGNGPKDIRQRALRLAGARITGTLDLEAATVACPISLRRCFFDQPINLREAQVFVVRLPGCRAPGLDGQQLQTRGNLELDDGFVATGEVNLLGAHIGGTLGLRHATLTNSNGCALMADKLTVDQSIICHPGFKAQGEINFVAAHIGSNLEFDGALLSNPNSRALTAARLTVNQDVFCRDGFTAQGEVLLIGAHIGGQLDLTDATLTRPGGIALDLEGVRIPTLYLLPKESPEGAVRLARAHIDAYTDSQATWPQNLYLRGFTYGQLVAEPEVDVATRLRWLEHDPGGYTPQLYEQLASAYRTGGRDDDARKVAIAKQRRRRQALNPAGKVWNSLLRWTVGYGYHAWKAGVWLLVLVGLGWGIFERAHSPYPAHLLAAKPPGQRPSFHAELYALDLLLPFADLGYQSNWIAGEWARWFYLGWNLAGWVLITAVVAALSGLIKRD